MLEEGADLDEPMERRLNWSVTEDGLEEVEKVSRW